MTPESAVNVNRRLSVLALFTLALVGATFGVWRALVTLALHDDTASHVVLIPLVSAALIVQDRRRAFADIRWAPAAGGALVAAGLAVLLGARFGVFVAGREQLSAMVASRPPT